MTAAPVPPYAGLRVDREPARRRDPGWVEAERRALDTLVVPVHGGSCYLRDGTLVTDAPRELATHYLGRWQGRAVFVADLSAHPRSGLLDAEPVDSRAAFGSLTPAEAALVAHARGLCHWHRHGSRCPACGAPTTVADHGGHRVCDRCHAPVFPRLEPAVMALITTTGPDPRVLLVRHTGAGPDSLALVAGFVEIGESLEDAVVREVAEEVGLHVTACRYLASQPWPFPAGLMIGFRAVVRDTAARPGDGEIADARWFTAAELAARGAEQGLGHPDSLNRWLLTTWLAAPDPGGSAAA